jgi:hypothetical protein
MSNIMDEIQKLESKIEKEIEIFENANNCSVALIDYESYLYDASRDSLLSTLVREVNVSIKRK